MPNSEYNNKCLFAGLGDNQMKNLTMYRDNLEYVGRLTFLIDNDDATHLDMSFNRMENKDQDEVEDNVEHERSYALYLGVCDRQGLTPLSFAEFKNRVKDSESIPVLKFNC